MTEEIFKYGTISEEELKELEESEPVEISEAENKELLDMFAGEYVEREYIVIDVQRPNIETLKSGNLRKIDLYVLGEEEPLTIDVKHPKLKEIIGYINEFKIVRIKVRQLKVKVMEDDEIKEHVARDIEDVIEVEPLDPLEYFKKNNVKHGKVMLRQGKSSPYLREDGVIKLVVSGYTVNGWRLNSSLSRDKLTPVLLVPAISKKRDGITLVKGCWFKISRKEEKTEEEVEEEIEKLVKEAEMEQLSRELPQQIEV